VSGHSIQYRLIQFLADPMREEGRNIGVLAFDGRWAGFKGIGMTGGTRPNLSGYATITGNSPDIWVFGEWIEWFKSLCRESEGNVERINTELNLLPDHSPQFAATDGGLADADGRTSETVLEDLFGQLVGEPRRRGNPVFKEQVREALIRSELWFIPGFEESVEVSLRTESPEPEVFMLDYFLEGEQKAGFKTIKFKGSKSDTLDAKVNDAIHAFLAAQDNGFIERERCFILCDAPCQNRKKHENRLSSVATLVDVTRDDAHRELASLIA